MVANRFIALRGPGVATELARAQDNIGATVTPVVTAVNRTPIGGAPPPPWVYAVIIAASGYAQVAAPAPRTAYHKDALGYVHGKVALTTAAGAGPNVIAFTLDLGYRPSETLAFAGSDLAGNVWDATISANGSFTIVSTLAAAGVFQGTFTYLAEG